MRAFDVTCLLVRVNYQVTLFLICFLLTGSRFTIILIFKDDIFTIALREKNSELQKNKFLLCIRQYYIHRTYILFYY